MKIICIGRNYLEHAKELNNLVPEEPIFFMKPDSALLLDNKPFFLPEFSTDIQHEVELVIRIYRLGKHIEEKFASKYYSEVGLGIDFTARDIQQKCKEKGLPWEIAKAFDQSAVVGNFSRIDKLPDLNNLNFELYKNDELVQKGNSGNMIFSVDKIIEYVSKFVTLKIGDLIFTGTPSGVGSVKVGDKLTGKLEGNIMFEFSVK
jgi:2-keto-4-pentenoate hydratase/2-oxohepta-3-ene-1,7-dioic acid hydratase in catechol pathway